MTAPIHAGLSPIAIEQAIAELTRSGAPGSLPCRYALVVGPSQSGIGLKIVEDCSQLPTNDNDPMAWVILSLVVAREIEGTQWGLIPLTMDTARTSGFYTDGA